MENLFEYCFRKRRIAIVKKYIKPGSVVCDIGCGRNGTVLRKLRTHIKKGIGFDKKVANSKFENIEFKNILIDSKLPKIESSDYVLMLAVLEHLENPEEILKECKNLLKKDGKILLTTPSPRSKYILEFLSLLKLVNPEEIRDHKHYFSSEDLQKILLKCGFKNVVIKTFEVGLNTFAIASK